LHNGKRLSTRELVINALRAVRLNRVAARLYYRFFHGFASAGRELPGVVHRCLKQALAWGTGERGDYYEFGVFKGHTFLQAQLSARALGMRRMRFFGFDSFQGLPPVAGVDRTPEEPFYEGQYACPLDQVKHHLTRGGADWSRTFLIEGFFKDTLNEQTRATYRMAAASVVLLDSDLYESAAAALAFLADALTDPAILIMDDWDAFNRDPSRGERLALAEFLRRHPEWSAEPWFTYPPYGQVFVLRRSPQHPARPAA
jgi:hypothetical protein